MLADRNYEQVRSPNWHPLPNSSNHANKNKQIKTTNKKTNKSKEDLPGYTTIILFPACRCGICMDSLEVPENRALSCRTRHDPSSTRVEAMIKTQGFRHGGTGGSAEASAEQIGCGWCSGWGIVGYPSLQSCINCDSGWLGDSLVWCPKGSALL